MPKFSAYMRGEGVKGDAAGFGVVSATSYDAGYDSSEVSVTTSGEYSNLNVDFSFGLQRGPTGNVSYATFDINPNDGILYAYHENNYDDRISFSLDENGILSVLISTTTEGD